MVRRANPVQAQQLLPGVKNTIAIASGKGGVGKSTVSVNLAVALAQAGARVGLLDADITGPNVPLMLGVEGQPSASANNKITPLERYGVKVISIQFFVPEGQPVVWRGPLVGGAIQQFLRDVEWGDLDYLVIDQPPGTSDAQLTLAQAIPISGTVLVTTPQDVVLLDVQKALAMLKRMSVPVIGIVENMSAFVCPHCGEATEIFGRGGGERFAQRERHRVPRRHAARRDGAPGRRRRRPGGRPARTGSRGPGADPPRPDRGGPHERARCGATAAAGALDQLDRNNLAGGLVSALRGPRRSSATPLARGLQPAAPPVGAAQRPKRSARVNGSRRRVAAAAFAPARRPHAVYAIGFCQRISVNRAKSVSAEQTSRPCSIARAARCPSGMRLPLSR